jgi:AcrR family transcriptional regulator
MKRPQDPRIIRTRHLLRDALIDLMEEKGVDGLNVRDLTKKAGLNRGTFYLHYRDIHDLLQQSKSEILEGLRHILDRSRSRRKDDPKHLTESSLIPLFEYLAEHRRFFQVMLDTKGDPSFIYQLKELMKQILYKSTLEAQPSDEEMLVPRDYLIAHVTSSTLGVIQHWFECGMNFSPQEMSKIVYRLIMLSPEKLSGLHKK